MTFQISLCNELPFRSIYFISFITNFDQAKCIVGAKCHVVELHKIVKMHSKTCLRMDYCANFKTFFSKSYYVTLKVLTLFELYGGKRHNY